MMSQVVFGLIIVTAFLAAMLATFFMLHISHKLGLASQPNHRSSHNKVTPHGGGLGFVIVFLSALFLLFLFGHIDEIILAVFIGCGGVVAGIGLLDDIYPIAARWRFSAYLLAVTFGMVFLGGLPPVNIGNQLLDFGLFGDIGVVLLLLWWLNLYNFMDGIDALAAVEALSILLGAVLLLWLGGETGSDVDNVNILLLLLFSTVLGFLVWNCPPARIFMGDVGSTFLGFALGMLAIISIAKGFLSPWVWMILGSVFIVDSTVTLLQRILKGECWYEAHRSHAYQNATLRLIAYFETTKESVSEGARTKAHGIVSLCVLMINALWLLPLAYMAQSLPAWGSGIVLIAWLPLVLLAVYLGAGSNTTK